MTIMKHGALSSCRISAGTALVLSLLLLAGAPALAAENPPLSGACGLDIALVIDSSDSIDAAELTTMKSAMNDFIDSLSPSTPSLFSVVDFDQVTHVTPFTDDKGIAHAAVNAAARGGGTNWQQALLAAQGLFDPRTDHENLIIFASDGNPNYVGNPATATSSQAALDAAVSVADSIKSSGTRILAIGIGNDQGPDALDIGNMVQIAGPRVNDGDISSDVITSDWAGFADALRSVAIELCGTPVTSGGNGAPIGTFTANNAGGGGIGVSGVPSGQVAGASIEKIPAPVFAEPAYAAENAPADTVSDQPTDIAPSPSSEQLAAVATGNPNAFPWWLLLLLLLALGAGYATWRYRSTR